MQANDILFFGDTHGGFYHCLDIVQQVKPKAIVFLGDLQAPQPLDEILHDVIKLTDVWWIPGNHDTDNEEYYDNLFSSHLKDKNLHGRVETIAGIRIAGLGGVFRGRIWSPHKEEWNYYSQEEFFKKSHPRTHFRNGLSLKQRSSIFPETYMMMRNMRSDILVTHEAPSCNKFGFYAIDRLARQMGVRKVFHGHHHDTYAYQAHFPRMHFEAYAVGYRGACNLAGEVIRPGEMDGEFADRVAILKKKLPSKS